MRAGRAAPKRLPHFVMPAKAGTEVTFQQG
jgi:hypothetical protein